MLKANFVLDAIGTKYHAGAMARELVLSDPAAIERNGDRRREWVARGGGMPFPADEPNFRRIDALLYEAMQYTAIEVKVSRSDFLRETPEKRWPWQQITNRFVYATPKGLLKPEEIPSECGLWEVDEFGKVSVAKRAKITAAKPIPNQLFVALMYRHNQRGTR
jgi:hypothetical protein